jgi:putative transposase
MPNYIRAWQPGGTFFFTVVTHKRRPFLTDEQSRHSLRRAMEETRLEYPFRQDAVVLLPDHLHCLWTLPKDDTNFSLRWKVIKLKFTRFFLQAGGTEWTVSDSKRRRHERGLWQRRFWEHTVRNEREFEILCNYIHYNPVKHGHADVRIPGRFQASTSL